MNNQNHNPLTICLMAILLVLASCGHHYEKPTPLDIKIPYGFPTRLNIPDDNPLTVEGVELGRTLFHDPHLCGYTGNDPDSLMSCASCHDRAHNYDLGPDNPRVVNGHPVGRRGKATRHNAMPLMNLVFNHEGYFWNGSVRASVLQSSSSASIAISTMSSMLRCPLAFCGQTLPFQK